MHKGTKTHDGCLLCLFVAKTTSEARSCHDLLRGPHGGDYEDDSVAGRTDVEGADNHRFTFKHADVCRHARTLVIDRRSDRAVGRDVTSDLNRNARAKIEALPLHDWLAAACGRELHHPDTEITKAWV